MAEKKEKKINVEALREGLEALTGYDYEACEKAAHAQGDTSPLMVLSSVFQTLIAARVLKVSPAEIKMLPIKEYSQITTEVSRFLLAGSEETVNLLAE